MVRLSCPSCNTAFALPASPSVTETSPTARDGAGLTVVASEALLSAGVSSASAEAAKADIRRSVARRMQTATEQIAAAEQSAIRQIKDQAVTVAVAAAGDVLRDKMKAAESNRMIDAAITEIGSKLH